MAGVLAAWPAAALLTRPDREDAEYRELASKYPSSIALAESASEAVLIAPRWLLVPGPRAQALEGAGRIAIGGARYDIEKLYEHPSGALALVFLRTPVADVEPSPVYRPRDEQGKPVAFVGHGRGAARAAINTVDRVDANSLSLRVKPLDEASDLQGSLTADELGAPLFIEVSEEPFVAGIAVDAGREWQTFARLSSYAAWIDDSMWKSGTDHDLPRGRTLIPAAPGASGSGVRPRGASPGEKAGN
jgi:hypothetical protein